MNEYTVVLEVGLNVEAESRNIAMQASREVFSECLKGSSIWGSETSAEVVSGRVCRCKRKKNKHSMDKGERI